MYLLQFGLLYARLLFMETIKLKRGRKPTEGVKRSIMRFFRCTPDEAARLEEAAAAEGKTPSEYAREKSVPKVSDAS